jgi:hypothetical protein
MPLFRRRRDDDIDDEYDDGDEYGDREDSDDTADEGESPARTPTAAPRGPWDVADVDDEVTRLDLGTIQVPVPPGCEIRVDVQEDHTVTAATLVQGNSALQIHVFAAPRTEGIWADVRTEILESLRGSGGSAEPA